MSDFASPPPPPPPPAMPGSVSAKAGPAGWGAVVAAVLGLLSLVLPWYSPKLGKPINGVTDLGSTYHSWSGFFFLIAGPLLLIVFGVMWFQALRGQQNSRFAGAADPIRALSLQSIGAGAIALVLGLLSFALVSHHYKDWDTVSKEVKGLGSSLEKNPQIGLYALFLGAIVLIGVGVAGLVLPGAPGASGSSNGRASNPGQAPGSPGVFPGQPGGGYGTNPSGDPQQYGQSGYGPSGGPSNN